MNTRDITYFALGCVSAFLGVASWFVNPPGALILALAAITLSVTVLWKTRRSTR